MIGIDLIRHYFQVAQQGFDTSTGEKDQGALLRYAEKRRKMFDAKRFPEQLELSL